eukprot:889786-Pelagomonas_calceolata.AAC.1
MILVAVAGVGEGQDGGCVGVGPRRFASKRGGGVHRGGQGRLGGETSRLGGHTWIWRAPRGEYLQASCRCCRPEPRLRWGQCFVVAAAVAAAAAAGGV